MESHELVFTLLDTAAKITKRLDRSLSAIKGISFSEYQLLSALGSRPGAAATRVDLAESIGLSPSGVTRALKPLEKLGFVETTKDERDARRSLAVLAPAGVELLSDATRVVSDALAGLPGFASLSADDAERLVGLMRVLEPR